MGASWTDRLRWATPHAVAVVVLLLTTGPAAAELLTGWARATDGDTVRVAGIAVRLKGVAAPEVKHPGQHVDETGGQAAADFMRQLVEGRVLVCRLDGRDIGEAVIAASLARDYPRYSGGRYAGIERPEAARLSFPSYCRLRR